AYDALMARASILKLTGALREAADTYRAASLVKACPEPSLRTAEVLSALGEPSKAIMLYEDVLSQDPGNVDALMGLGSAYASSGKLDTAVTTLHKALKLVGTGQDKASEKPSPHGAAVWNALGAVYRSLAKYSQALHCFQQCLSITPSNP
ncbi:hypothetical protein KIPB_011392, partial [Kipferlia bialata]